MYRHYHTDPDDTDEISPEEWRALYRDARSFGIRIEAFGCNEDHGNDDA